MMSFFTAYVRDDKAKMAAAFWSENSLSHAIGNYHTENTSIQFIKDQIELVEPTCGKSQIGAVFDHFQVDSDRTEDSSSVHVIYLGNELANTDNSLFMNRPHGDNNLIIVNDGPYDNNPIFVKQANILGCASRTNCDRVIKASEVSNQVESMVTRDSCLARHYSSLLRSV